MGATAERRRLARLRRASEDLRYLVGLRKLPPRAAFFDWRARRLATRTGDRFSLVSATRPADLSVLLALARGRRRVVELGTGTGWTALALALVDSKREVVTYDPIERPERERYLTLAVERAASQIAFVNDAGSSGPRDGQVVDLLYIDSSHGRQETIEELQAWRPALRPGSLIVLDDFTHPEFPGVREAVDELGLEGTQHGTLFVHEHR